MICYYLLLTIALPSILTTNLDWIKNGVFAEYSVEDSGGNGPIRNGTYTWTIIDLQPTTVALNETFTGSTLWDHVTTIPPTGRLVTVSIRDGNVEDLILWLKRFYHPILIDRTLILGTGSIYAGIEEPSLPYQGVRRDATHWFPLPKSWRRAFYDQSTGLLLRYTWTWIRLGTITVSLQSTNIPILTIPSPSTTPKIILGAFLLSPFVILPAIGAILGLRILKRQRVAFDQRFWVACIPINGLTLALVANWPITTSILDLHSSIYWYPGTALFIILGLNTLLWTGILTAVAFLIHHFAIPLSTRPQ
jgi:hypothetical protein